MTIAQKKFSIFLFFILLIAAGLRFYVIQNPPLGFHTGRQFRSALIARSFYYEKESKIPDWRRQIALLNRKNAGMLEPPVTEWLAAQLYRVYEQESLKLARLLAACFWFLGAFFVHRIMGRLAGPFGAFLSTAFYLLFPYGMFMSTAIQPDALMFLFWLVSCSLLIHFAENPSTIRFLFLWLAFALTMTLKPVAGPTLLVASFLVGWWQWKQKKLVNFGLYLKLMVLSVLPTLIYYLYGIFTGEHIADLARGDILFHLWKETYYWRGWWILAGEVVGYTALGIALFGLLLSPTSLGRVFLLGLFIGYFAQGLIFNRAIYTHEHHQLTLLGIVCFGIGIFGQSLMNFVAKKNWDIWIWRPTLILGFLLISLGIFKTFRVHEIYSQNKLEPVSVLQEIGEKIKHSSNLLHLGSSYSFALQYYGQVAAQNWPLAYDLETAALAKIKPLAAQERFEKWNAKYPFDYFIVTYLDELEKQPDLKQFLDKNFAVLEKNSDYMIFDLKQKLVQEVTQEAPEQNINP